MNIKYHGITDPGNSAAENQDQFLTAKLNKSIRIDHTSISDDEQFRVPGDTEGYLLLVADGVHEGPAGKRASSLATGALMNYLAHSAPWFLPLAADGQNTLLEDFCEAAEFAQRKLAEEGERRPEKQGMAATLTMAYIRWPEMFLLHVGNGRCYLSRKGELKQLTRDQDGASRQDKTANRDEPAVAHSPSLSPRSVVGGDLQGLRPEVLKFNLEERDAVLICTDGLTNHVGDATIAEALGSNLEPEEICSRLVDSAKAGGGSDNITAIAAVF